MGKGALPQPEESGGVRSGARPRAEKIAQSFRPGRAHVMRCLCQFRHSLGEFDLHRSVIQVFSPKSSLWTISPMATTILRAPT